MYFAIIYVIFLCMAVVLSGCQNLGYSNMSAEQIKATAGTTTCTQIKNAWGMASTIALNQDETRKGASSTNEINITCGDAQMSIKGQVTTPPPVPKTISTQ